MFTNLILEGSRRICGCAPRALCIWLETSTRYQSEFENENSVHTERRVQSAWQVTFSSAQAQAQAPRKMSMNEISIRSNGRRGKRSRYLVPDSSLP
jgi:hypothetical protein